MVGEQQVGSRAQTFEARAATLGALDLQVDGLRPGLDARRENANLYLLFEI